MIVYEYTVSKKAYKYIDKVVAIAIMRIRGAMVPLRIQWWSRPSPFSIAVYFVVPAMAARK